MRIGTIQQIWLHPVKSMAGEQLDHCVVGPLGIPGDRGWALRDETTGEITNAKRIPLLMQCSAVYRESPSEENIPAVNIVLPDGSAIGSDDPGVNARLSEVLGKSVSLWPREPVTNREHYRRKSKNARLVGSLAKYQAFRSLLPTLTKIPALSGQLREAFSREPNEPFPDISVLPPEVLEFVSPLGTYFDAFPLHLLTTATLDEMKRRNQTSVWDVRRFRPNFLLQTSDELKGFVEAGWTGHTLKLGEVRIKCEIPCPRCGMTTHAQKGLPKDPAILRSIVKEADQNIGIYANVLTAGRVRVGDPVELI